MNFTVNRTTETLCFLAFSVWYFVDDTFFSFDGKYSLFVLDLFKILLGKSTYQVHKFKKELQKRKCK